MFKFYRKIASFVVKGLIVATGLGGLGYAAVKLAPDMLKDWAKKEAKAKANEVIEDVKQGAKDGIDQVKNYDHVKRTDGNDLVSEQEQASRKQISRNYETLKNATKNGTIDDFDRGDALSRSNQQKHDASYEKIIKAGFSDEQVKVLMQSFGTTNSDKYNVYELVLKTASNNDLENNLSVYFKGDTFSELRESRSNAYKEIFDIVYNGHKENSGSATIDVNEDVLKNYVTEAFMQELTNFERATIAEQISIRNLEISETRIYQASKPESFLAPLLERNEKTSAIDRIKTDSGELIGFERG